MDGMTLTPDQQAAYEAFVGFVINPDEPVFVLSGYAGTGKTTLVKKLVEDLPQTLKTAKLLNADVLDWEIVFTATTNKACEALSDAIHRDVSTIQSYLRLTVQKDYRSQTSSLVKRRDCVPVFGKLIIIDEASYIDNHLFKLIRELTPGCKLMFIGDPAQLTPVRAKTANIFSGIFPTATLTQVVRQAEDNPIIELATAFRNTVNTGEFFSFRPDGKHITYAPKEEFENNLLDEFSRPTWKSKDSKVLAWTNKAVINYNHGIRHHLQGAPELEEGDYAVVNNYINIAGVSFRTDQLVQVTSISPDNQYGVDGWVVELNHHVSAFMPRHLADKKALIKKFTAENQAAKLAELDTCWVDLRAAYACTINKSQGSTYDRVFIDLDDVRRCNSGDQIARMLYVAVSRARHEVHFTGDLV